MNYHLEEGKAALRRQIDNLVLDFLLAGGMIRVCRPAIAVGSELGRLQRIAIRHG